ncbi:undecaprenyl-diphosphate phosphatase [Sandaracinobacter sp. RS1-74]|uniref:undecaprenyl-diphosphate phosphatase n=1 Tax=Sandaracinobacteroides sayramensis TaxID=2913411 RepID=UPI001ED9F62F|nr:undecaprenyl-diphosphate phosphatase [Sandaracinobacteroides sayramensis]MCG2841995.1 undecaprenyl-diphosphate phosphatase [Sandaracinobacteroides sayramensis]
MSWLEAALLGVVQGLTEFLPISSSAHLRIVGEFLPSATDPGAAFTAITQIGTEAAVLLYFRRDIWRIGSAWLRSPLGKRREEAPDVRLGWLVILGTLPIAILGLVFKDWIEGSLRNLYITASMLILFGILLGAADRFGLRKRELSGMTLRDGILLGFAQAMALVPGVSRSGGTISIGLLLGYTREAAARYSFLLAIPAVLASGFYQLFRHWGEFGPFGFGETALATAISFLVGYGVIVAFLRIISSYSFMPFVWYRVAVGSLLLILIGFGILSPI